MIQVPILAVTKKRERFLQRAETNTLVGNAQGGLMELRLEVVARQPLLLIIREQVRRIAALLFAPRVKPAGSIR
jgi:hypothetical protein